MLRLFLPAAMALALAAPTLSLAQINPTLERPPPAVTPIERPVFRPPPRITAVTPDPGMMVSSPLAVRTSHVTVTITDLPPGVIRYSFRLDPASASPEMQAQIRQLAGRCVLKSDGFTTGTDQAVNGVVRLRVIGSFRYGFDPQAGQRDAPAAPPDNFSGPCATVLTLVAERPDGSRTSHVVRGPDVSLTPLKRYVIGDTWSLRRQFDFGMKPERGTCSGASVTPSGSFPVGPHERNGDLALQVRSGPVGTACVTIARAKALPAGFTLIAWDWEAAAEGDKCGLGNDGRPSGIPADNVASPGSLLVGFFSLTLSDQVSCCDGNQAAQTRFGFSPSDIPDDRPATGSVYLRMNCKETAFNDHGVRAVLKSATFEGPGGVAFP